MNLTWRDKLLLKSIAYVSNDDTLKGHIWQKPPVHTACVRKGLNPYKDRKFKQAGCGGAGGEPTGSTALHISTA